MNRNKKRQRGGATQAERASKQEESIQPNNTLVMSQFTLNVQCGASIRSLVQSIGYELDDCVG